MESRLDHIYRRVLLTKFFTRGWGSPDHLVRIIKLRKLIGSRSTNVPYIQTPASVVQITKQERQDNEVVLLEGRFTSPALEYLGEDIIPPEVRLTNQR